MSIKMQHFSNIINIGIGGDYKLSPEWTAFTGIKTICFKFKCYAFNLGIRYQFGVKNI
jgi:hypothetical protein